jgi:multiple sugar transport system permease protein
VAALPARWKLLTALWTVYLVWGSTYLAIKLSVRTLPAFLSAGSRFLLAGLLLALILQLTGRSLRVTRRELASSALLGISLLGLGVGLVTLAETRIDSSIAAMIAGSVPLQVILISVYQVAAQLGLVNTLLGMIIPPAATPTGVFLLRQYMLGIPDELIEAARIDGAGHARIFGQITLPLMVPALATTTIFTFIWTWGDFFGPLIYLRTRENFPVSVALKGFIDAQSSSNYGAMFAMSVVSLIPLFLAFLIGQKYLVKGIATTGIK